ncbi:hypothetical protein MTP02_39060 [Streptomyces albus]|nr:hypothetical protein MTP02_39060 [Streptomyces albus]
MPVTDGLKRRRPGWEWWPRLRAYVPARKGLRWGGLKRPAGLRLAGWAGFGRWVEVAWPGSPG